jgi:glucose/arabinose dehydrogenase
MCGGRHRRSGVSAGVVEELEVRRLFALFAILWLTPAGAQEPAVEVLADNLENPWGLALLPDGRMLLTERAGRLTLRDAAGKRVATVRNVPPAFVKLQGGLFDVVLDPSFATNSLVYLSLAHGEQKRNTTRVIRARLQGDALEDIQVIFDNTPKGTSAHYGGRLAFRRDGTLLVTTGEGAEYREDAQRLGSTLGKIVRVNTDGSAPQDNPFIGRDGADARVWSYGHRNPQGLYVDPLTDTIYSVEHGPRGGDELNLIEAGANYGWPIATHGLDYTGGRISPFETYPGVTEPLIFWTPSIGIGGVAIYHGAMFPEWEGDALVGALGHRHLVHVDLENGRVVNRTKLLESRKARFRQISIAPDGAVLAVVDDVDGRPASGQVLRLSR